MIVASMGRSGSTLIFNAVRKGMAKHRFGFESGRTLRIVSDSAWDMGSTDFYPGVVYKTHGLASELPETFDTKAIFVFGSATDAALSVYACRQRYGEAWITEHFKHLRANGDFDELATRDVLRFADQLKSWTGKHRAERLIIHYDALWDHAALISDFCGFKVALPERVQRTSTLTVPPDIRQQFQETYQSLDSIIEKMPPWQIIK